MDLLSKMNRSRYLFLNAHTLKPCGLGAPRPQTSKCLSRLSLLREPNTCHALEISVPTTQHIQPWVLGAKAGVY